MQNVRYKFGPRIVGTLSRPAVPGERPDVEVTASIKAIRPNDPGKVDADVAFTVPAYDVATHAALVEVHAIACDPAVGLPATPELALAAASPKASADATGHTAGGDLVVTLSGVPTGSAVILTVLGFAVPAAPATPAS